METAQKTRNGTIDFWRFIFAIYIMLYHLKETPFFADLEAITSWAKGASIGVEFFFILSGFLMAKPKKDYSMKTGEAVYIYIYIIG